jgi:hypothetical protein
LTTTKLILALALVCLSASSAVAQTIITVAGNGTAGYSGDGGPATAAQLFGPKGVALDPAGNLYIADEANNCIRKVSVGTGFITTFAGTCGAVGAYGGDTLPATQADLNQPFNVFCDSSGNVYISDRSNHVIRKVDTLGIITTVAGNGTQCPGMSACGDGGPATSAELYRPSGLAVDPSGNIYIGDAGDFCIRKVNTSGTISTIAGDPNHYIAASGSVNVGDGGPAHLSFLYSPHALALDASGNLYIADFLNQVIRKITVCSGQITGNCPISRAAGNYGNNGSSGDGGPATSATLSEPSGLAIDIPNDILYVSDKDSRRVRAINTAGIINAFAGTGVYGYAGDNGPATSARLADPWQLAVDACGSLYIADSSASVIRKVLKGAPSVLNPSITTGASLCNGKDISVTGHYTGLVPPDGHSWQLQSCTSAGVPTNAYDSGVLTYAGAPSTTPFVFPNTASLGCNQNYLITLVVKKNCPVPTTARTTRQVFVNCTPAPIITGNTTICRGASTTLCANYPNNSQYTVQWTYRNGGMAIDVDAQCITVRPTTNTTYNMSVVDNATGCAGSAAVNVAVVTNNSEFTYRVNYTSPDTHFTITATPVTPHTNSVVGFGDLWVVEQIDSLGNAIPGTNTSTGATPNPTCWWIYPAPNTFDGFDGTKNSGINNVTCPAPSPGKFANASSYRITHGIWNNFCPWSQTSHTVTLAGHRPSRKTRNSDARTPDYRHLKPSPVTVPTITPDD